MRGRPPASLREPQSEGNTPAYAGKTPPDWTNWSRWKHPRVCGEDPLALEGHGTR